ncbi:hypothetical protein [Polynucleobacter sp. Fuers-14]|uniref:hypothetical protein n=1 Tax=Polynucleobacter sp. Fuers-14 TaxID=1758364 RepID=UPI001C0BCCC0|nr:hypothetical protein [Polynucleobacter sp. Fuers-14]MBU3640828.1 hypothetical protein [Polynucleobacter sp. Fuers-14]
MLSYQETKLLKAFRGMDAEYQERFVEFLAYSLAPAIDSLDEMRRESLTQTLEWFSNSHKEIYSFDKVPAEIIKFPKKKLGRKKKAELAGIRTQSGAKVISICG